MNHYCQVEGEIVKDGKLFNAPGVSKPVRYTNLDFVEAIATANGVETPRMDKLGRETNGWQGRYRMTVRNMLTKKVVEKGYLVVPEGVAQTHEEHAAPAEWLAAHAPKPKETGTARRLKTTPAAETPVEVVVDETSPVSVEG